MFRYKDYILFTVCTCLDVNYGIIIVDMLMKCKFHGRKLIFSNDHIELIIMINSDLQIHEVNGLINDIYTEVAIYIFVYEMYG